MLETSSPDIILVDLMLPHMSGLEFLEQAKKLLPRAEIAIMTGHASIETAVQAMRMGAYDYIEKPFRYRAVEATAPAHGRKSAPGGGEPVPA